MTSRSPETSKTAYDRPACENVHWVRPSGRSRGTRAGLCLGFGLSIKTQPSSTVPSRSAVAVTTSPALTGTAAVSPPDSTMSPARRPSFSKASDRTSQATAAAGCPSAAAPAAVATTSPLCSSTTPISRRSRPAAGTAEPTTYRPAEVLSATTSGIVNL